LCSQGKGYIFYSLILLNTIRVVALVGIYLNEYFSYCGNDSFVVVVVVVVVIVVVVVVVVVVVLIADAVIVAFPLSLRPCTRL
jgi:hypothetical protein